MIDITKTIVDDVKALGITTYLAWPEVDMFGARYAVVGIVSREPTIMDEDGGELAARLTYGVAVYDATPEKVMQTIEAVTDSLKKYRLRLVQLTPAWATEMGTYSAQAAYVVQVDKRGNCTR